MRRPIGLHIEHADDVHSVQTQCKRAVNAGFDGIELPVQAVASPGDGSGEIAVDSLLTDLARVDLKVVAVAARSRTCQVEPAIEQVRSLLNRAANLRARCLNLSIPPLQSYGGGIGFARYQDALNFAYHLLHEVRYEAESTGVAVALEAVVDGCLLSPVELRETIHQANSWAVGACIDVNRIARIGSPPDWLATLRRQVHSVRVRDAVQGDPHVTERQDQPVDFAAISTALDEIHYEGPIIASGSGEPEQVWKHLTEARLVGPL